MTLFLAEPSCQRALQLVSKLTSHGDDRTLEKATLNYDTIQTTRIPDSVRTSHFFGPARSESGPVFGLLLTYMDCEGQT